MNRTSAQRRLVTPPSSKYALHTVTSSNKALYTSTTPTLVEQKRVAQNVANSRRGRALSINKVAHTALSPEKIITPPHIMYRNSRENCEKLVPV
jgi:hypothetical protein